MAAEPTLLRLSGITKAYPGVLANNAISIDLGAGEIHGVLGENGAGKTTLMGVLYGLHQADRGEIFIDGRSVEISSPRDALALGVGFVQQHFSLIPTLTVAENLTLALRHGAGRIRRANASDMARQLSNRYRLDVDPDSVVETLGVGKQQRAELLKALARNVRILILDEPTSVLTPQEADHLAEVLAQLNSEGLGVFYISHNLDEVLKIADRVTVLRNGSLVATLSRQEVDHRKLAEMMVGTLDAVQRERAGPPPDDQIAPLVAVRDLWVRGDRGEWAVKGVNLDLRPGEVVGLAGVEGNGQVELTEALTGVRPWARGHVTLRGGALRQATAREAIDRHGVAHVPADRQHTGLVADLSIAHNLALPLLHREPYSRYGVLRPGVIHERAQALMRRFNIRGVSPDVEAGTLSGGNQQRMILARELSRDPDIVIACYATRGLDIAAAAATHDAVRDVRDRGGGVLYASVELNELLNLADRIVVLRGGRVTGEASAEEATAEQLGLWMGGAGA